MLFAGVRPVFLLLAAATAATAAMAASTNDLAAMKTVTLRRVAQCFRAHQLNMLLHDVHIATTPSPPSQNQRNISAELDVKEDIKNQFHVQLDVRKCDINGNPDHCEYVMRNYNLSNVCANMAAKTEMWSDIFNNIEPPLECPITKGTYILKTTPISDDKLGFLPFGNAIWKAQLNGFDGHLNILCVDIEVVVKLTYARSNPNRARRQ